MSRSLQFDIVANDKASAKLKDVQSVASKFARSIGGMVSGFFAIENIIGKIIAFGTETLSFASNLKDSAAAVGLTVTQFQQLQYAAQQAGVDVGQMQKAFLDLRKTMRDAQGGNEQAIAVFKALGYTQDQITAGNIDVMDAFLRVSKAISAASSEQEKFNIATAIFGDKVAMNLLKVLGDYAELKQNIANTPLIGEGEAEKLDRLSDRYERLLAIAKQLFTLGFLTAPQGAIQNLPGGNLGSAVLGAAGAAFDARTKAKPEPVTQQDKDAAAALAEAGRKKTAAAGLAAGQPGFSALATIGGAAGAVRGAGPSPELTALEKIEENTRPAMPVPANGSTDFSKGSGDAGFDAAAARARTIPTYGEYFARAARRAR